MSKTFAFALAFSLALTSSPWARAKEDTRPTPSIRLEDLGLPLEQTQSQPELQMHLEQRAHKLQAHQVTGLVTLGLMGASLLFAEQVEKNNLHQYLGGATAVGYWTTFYLSASAPRPEGIQDRGWNIKIHKAMRWIHGPLMILTPIAGIIAHQQIRRGEEPSGLGAIKGALGSATVLSYGLGTAVMAFEF